MPKRFVFTGKQQVQFEDFQLPAVQAGQVEVRTLYSLVSTGTETICLGRLFEPGTGWDAWVTYPFYPGYQTIGEVTEAGPGVDGLSVGDRVAVHSPHASHHVVAADMCYPVPADLDVKQANWFALAKIAFMGALAAEHRLGDRVLVIGAGPIGQMCTRWAHAAGAESLVVVDMIGDRLALARQGGATATFAKPIQECEADIRAASGGELPDIVIDGTGNAAVFAAALGLARHKGRVVLLGDTGTPSRQHLTHDVINKGLTVVGAHGTHSAAPWTERRIVRLFFDLIKRNRIDMSGMVSHEFAPADFAEAYDLATHRRGETMGILFNWT